MSRNVPSSEAGRRLDRRLREQLRWLRLRLLGRAALILLAGWGLLLAGAALALPGLHMHGEAAAWALRIVALAALVWVAVIELWFPLRRIAGLEEFAHELERHEAWDNVLAAATQFRSGEIPSGASAELVDAILERAATRTQDAALARRIPLSGLATHFGFALVAVVLLGVTALFAPDRIAQVSRVVLDPGSLAQIRFEGGIYAVSGDQRVPVGDPVTLRARDFTGGEDVAVVEIDRTGGLWQPTDLSADQVLEQGEYRELEIEVPVVEDPFRYRFRRGTVVSAAYEVAIRERPVVTGVKLELRPPAYSGRPDREVSDPAGAINALAGTWVRLSGQSSSQLSQARRREDADEQPAPMQVDGKSFADTFTVSSDREFRIELVDEDGFAGEALTVYRIVAEPDLAPSVEIVSPAEDRPLERDLRLAISGVAADDVGLARLDLIWQHEGAPDWQRIALLGHQDASLKDLKLDEGEGDLAVEFVWDLGQVDLLPGDGLIYALEATDNNARVGGQVTRSRTWRLTLPTIAEVFAEDQGERAASDDDLRDLLAEGKKLKDDLARLNRELLKDPDPEWQKKEEIRETLERQEALRKNLQDAADEMRRQMEDFERDNAGNVETLDKMEMIQDLLKELKDDESLQAWLEAMQDAMDELSPMEIQRQMEDSLAAQEEFNRRLDRTIELLKELERERRMSDLVEETNEHLRRQRELAEMTRPDDNSDNSDNSDQSDQSDQSDTPDPKSEESGESQDQQAPSDKELAEMQQRLQEQVKGLEEQVQEELDRLREESEGSEEQSPSAEEMQKALEKALEQLQEQKPSEPMQDASDQLSEGDREEASESQDEAHKRMLSLYEVFMEGQNMMQQSSAKFAGEKLQQTAFDLLQLSHRQEIVVDALQDGVRGQNMRPLTREQSRISRATDHLSNDLADLARQNFNIPERLLGAMRGLVDLSEATGEELEFGRAGRSRESARDVMGDMNQLVTNLLTAAQSTSGGGGGSQSMPSPSQQMRQMAEDQQRLNGMTQEMRERTEQGLSEGERRQLAEMRGRQQAIREQLQALRGQLDDERRVLGDLDDLADAMEQVEEGLGSDELDPDLQRQQENIHSRLLDAERSIRERDFAQRRESRGAEQIFGEQTGEEHPSGEDERESALRRFTAPERAPEAWREDVRRYFRSIQRELDAQKGGGR